MTRLVLGLLLLSAFGCGGDDRTQRPPIATVTLGSTNPEGSGFVPFGSDTTLISGAQGGFHVWLKYRVAGMAPSSVRAVHTARRLSDGKLVLLAERGLDIGAASAPGFWELPLAHPAFMCPTPIGIAVQGQTIRLRVELFDEDDTLLGAGEAETTPRCPEGEQAQFCMSICNG